VIEIHQQPETAAAQPHMGKYQADDFMGRIPPVSQNLFFFVAFVHFVVFVIIKAGPSRTNRTSSAAKARFGADPSGACAACGRASAQRSQRSPRSPRLQCKTAKTFFEQSVIEIHQQPETAAAQPHVGEYLGLVDGKDSFDGFDFDYYRFFYDQVGPEAARQVNALIDQRQNDLSIHKEISLPQLPKQTLLIDFFQKSRPEHPMTFYGQADDFTGRVPPVHQNLFFFVTFVHFVTFVRIKAGTSRTNLTNDSEIDRTKNLPGP
jgi:hypothetical protein